MNISCADKSNNCWLSVTQMVLIKAIISRGYIYISNAVQTIGAMPHQPQKKRLMSPFGVSSREVFPCITF